MFAVTSLRAFRRALISIFTITTAASAQDMAGMPGMAQQGTMIPGPLGISMDRMGSGTTWIPDAVRLPSTSTMAGSWELMLHGFGFLQYDKQEGPRGGEQFGSLNWAMLMASRDLAGGRLQLRTMLSLDPGTVTAQGYPLLLQTGESYNGEPLRDRQHPHDFWMELAALYERELNSSLAFSIYAAPSGEPALSPVAFMHRPSAMDDPVAPLGHHWMDATHISFGVVTAGLFTRTWKLEGSVFNGREPDERRWNFDKLQLNSYSGRVTINPSENWSASVGYGYLKHPEILEPEESMHRVTVGLMHGKSLASGGQWATTFAMGRNKHTGEDDWTSAALLESEIIVDDRNTFFGRAELVEKSAGELVLPETGPNAIDHHQLFNVSSFSAGYIREVARFAGTTTGIGARGTVNFLPQELEPFYGSRNPLGLFVFLRIRPQLKADAAGGHIH